MEQTITGTLIQQIEKLSADQLHLLFPKIKEALLDFLAASYAARQEPAVKKVWAVPATPGNAPLIGQKAGCSAEKSALFNGYQGHYLDYDDTSGTVRGHVSAILIPVLLALASEKAVSGKRFLAAYGVGEEIMARLGRCIGRTHYEKGFHNTATLGILAGAMAGAWLQNLDPGQMASALGLAATQSSGMRLQFGTETKPLQVGLAAEKAVEAVHLAAAGVQGHPAILDGPLGYFSLYGDGSQNVSPILCQEWGKDWDLLENGLWFKKETFCSGAMHTRDAVEQIRAKNEFSAETIDRVEIIFPPGGDAALVKRTPKTGEEGRFSAEYVAAIGLLGEPYTPELFAPKPIPDRFRKLIQRTVRSHDGSVKPRPEAQPKGRFTIVKVCLKDGTCMESRVDVPKGAPGNPLTEEEQQRKLLMCCGKRVATGFREIVGNLENLDSMEPLLQLL